MDADYLGAKFSPAQPGKFLRFQAFQPQAKAIAMPVQHLDFSVLTVDKHIQRATKWI